jgi:hypothetical protein
MRRVLALTTAVVALLGVTCGLEADEPIEPIPFEIAGDHAFVDVGLRGEVLSFVFDTAAEAVALNATTAQRLGVEASAYGAIGGAAGTMQVGLATGLEIQMGGLTLRDATAILAPIDHLSEAAGRPIDGIVGLDVLRGRLVRLDHERSLIEVLDRRTTELGPWGDPCPVDTAGAPEVHARIQLSNGEAVEGSFLVDTGAGGFLTLTSALARQHDLHRRIGPTYSQTGLSFTDDPTYDRAGRVAGVELCGHEFPSEESSASTVPAVLSGARGGTLSGGRAGLIGNALLLRFDILFDLERNRLYLRPNSRWSAPIRADASGMQLVRRADGRTVVLHVVEASPAEEAGVLVGDELRSISGRAADSMTLAAIRDLLKDEQLERRLVVVRAGVEKAFLLRLRSLLTPV